MSTTQFIVDGEAYFDENGHNPVALPAGPFQSRKEASTWIDQLIPFIGETSIIALGEPDAAQFRNPQPDDLGSHDSEATR